MCGNTNTAELQESIKIVNEIILVRLHDIPDIHTIRRPPFNAAVDHYV